MGKEIIKSEDIAPKIWLFPIIGFIIGLISGFLSLILFKFLPFLLAGFLILGLLIFISGAHHTDGLIDFGDGLMVIGTPKRKIEAMHDVSIGTGGFTLGIIILISTGIALSYSLSFILISLVISEIGAKFAMVAACSLGKSAGTKTAEPFIKLNKKKHMLFSFILSIVLIYLIILIYSFFNLIYIELAYIKFIFSSQKFISFNNLIKIMIIYIIFILGISISLIIVLRLSNKHFNGITGDCLGALNEISRLMILIFFLFFFNLQII